MRILGVNYCPFEHCEYKNGDFLSTNSTEWGERCYTNYTSEYLYLWGSIYTEILYHFNLFDMNQNRYRLYLVMRQVDILMYNYGVLYYLWVFMLGLKCVHFSVYNCIHSSTG